MKQRTKKDNVYRLRRNYKTRIKTKINGGSLNPRQDTVLELLDRYPHCIIEEALKVSKSTHTKIDLLYCDKLVT